MRSIFTYENKSGIRTLVLIFIAVVLMIMDRHSERFSTMRAAISLPLASFQYLINWPNKFIDNLKTSFKSHEELVKENLKLKAEQLLIQSQLQRFIAIESENNYLKSLLHSSRKVRGKTLIAELLAVSSEPFVHQLILDKGLKDQVYVGQPVLDAFGVMGQIIQAGSMTSRVLLLNDSRSGISVFNSRTGIRAIATGDSYSGKMKLMYIPKTADIREGDIFITSGLGDHYPEGYPVGTVLSIKKDPGHQFATVTIQPSAHLESSRQVLLVWYQRNAE